MSIVVQVTLVNLSADVMRDLDGEQCPLIAVSALSSCTTAQEMLQQTTTTCCSRRSKDEESNEQVQGRLLKDVMRYVKVPDKYTALLSLLLKSQAFYKAHPPSVQKVLPVVDLPRTGKGKPFIPTTSSALENESSFCPISVSHQFPFCGIARLIQPIDTKKTEIKLGMDIVVFEPLRTDLYSSVEDYLQVFRESLTDWEWERIHFSQCSDQQLMIEFYLRWSMKEAYTKALGLGMYLDFCTFETRLDVVDRTIDDGSGNGIWSVLSGAKKGVHLHGHVVMGAKEACWDFYFLPLFDSETEKRATGCACICFGPLENDQSSSARFEEQVCWTTFQNVIAWHKEQ